jgi:hypothetical protein
MAKSGVIVLLWEKTAGTTVALRLTFPAIPRAAAGFLSITCPSAYE